MNNRDHRRMQPIQPKMYKSFVRFSLASAAVKRRRLLILPLNYTPFTVFTVAIVAAATGNAEVSLCRVNFRVTECRLSRSHTPLFSGSISHRRRLHRCAFYSLPKKQRDYHDRLNRKHIIVHRMARRIPRAPLFRRWMWLTSMAMTKKHEREGNC